MIFSGEIARASGGLTEDSEANSEVSRFYAARIVVQSLNNGRVGGPNVYCREVFCKPLSKGHSK